MKKSLKVFAAVILVFLLSICSVAYGSSGLKSIKAVINGYAISLNNKRISCSSVYYNGSLYIPFSIINSLGAKANFNAKSKSLNMSTNQLQSLTAENAQLKSENEKLKNEIAQLQPPASTGTEQTGSLPMSITKDKITITLNKVIQDDDSLKIYVTYKNDSGSQAMTGDCLTKVVSNGKQYEFDTDFNFQRYYDKDVDHAPDFIEPTVSANSVIFFKPIPNINKVNIVLSAEFNDYNFNNVTVEK